MSKNVAAKLVQVYSEIGNIPRNGSSSKFNYKYVMASDAADHVRRAFVKFGLVMIPSVQKVDMTIVKTNAGGEMHHAVVHMEFKVIDIATGEDIKFTFLGESADVGDKAVPKAITSAVKAAHCNLVMSGENVEEDEELAKAEKDVKKPLPASPSSYKKPEPVKAEAKPADQPTEAHVPRPTPPPQDLPKPPAEEPKTKTPKLKPADPLLSSTTAPELPSEVVTCEFEGTISTIIPAMKGKPASMMIKPADGTPGQTVYFKPGSLDVPALLRMQSSKVIVKGVCDITTGEPHLMHIAAL